MTAPSSAAAGDAASHPDEHWMNMLDHIMDGHHHHDITLEPDPVHNRAAVGSEPPTEKLIAAVGQKSEHPGSRQSARSATTGTPSGASPKNHPPSPPTTATASVSVLNASTTDAESAASHAASVPVSAAATPVAPASAIAPGGSPVASGQPVASSLSSAATSSSRHASAASATAALSGPPCVKPIPASSAASESPAPPPPVAVAGKPCPRAAADEVETSGGGSECDFGITAEARAQARSERKRTREKQRRSDVNAQFASLTALLRKIEQEDLAADTAEQRAKVGGSSRSQAADLEDRKSTLGFLNTIGRNGCPTNRADLISMTICVLERMHAQNGRMRKDRRELQRDLEASKKKGEELARKHKQAEAAAQQAALGAAHAAAMPKQDKVRIVPIFTFVLFMLRINDVASTC
uniref:BHLH domain-containing protein n=1 Tax=Odontella aurita TaxID=265563 RepID=A0A7S4N8P7_9STRA|mmetsp:Transcript_53312/g.159637  ORF Transcript_53312/g.159637 Transcript_53312/m.159637 type:complete len:410 (+) Transcript_53312:104-1333(+)